MGFLSVLSLFFAVLNGCDVVHVMLVVLWFTVLNLWSKLKGMRSRLQELSKHVQQLESENERMIEDSDRWHEQQMNQPRSEPLVIQVPGPEVARVPREVVVTKFGKCFHHASCPSISTSTTKSTMFRCPRCANEVRGSSE